MDDLYRDNILDHFTNPRNRGLLENPDIEFADDNPLCGDHLHFTMKVDENDRVVEVGWEGQGCAISQASASMMSEHIIGKTLDEIRGMTKRDVLDLLGIELGAVRIKCALLSLKVIKAGAYGLDGLPGDEEI